MQIMKAFFKSLNYKKISILLYFVIFLIIAVMLGINGQSTDTEAFKSENIKVYVVDKDNSVLSNAVIKYLKETEDYTELNTEDMEELKDDSSFGVINFAMIIPKGYEEDLLNGNTENKPEYVRYTQSSSGYLMENMINAFIKSYYIYSKCGMTSEAAAEKTLASATNDTNVNMYKNVKSDYSSLLNRPGITYFFKFEPYTVLMMIIIGICYVMLEFNKKDIAKRINCSSLSYIRKNMQIVLAYIITGSGIWLLYMILACILYNGGSGFDNILFYGINSYVITMVGLAMAYLISNLINNENVINMIANIVILGMSFISGIFVQQSLMSKPVLTAAHFLPTYWYVKASDIIFSGEVRAADAGKFWFCIFMQVLFAVGIMAVGMAVSRIKSGRKKA